MYSKSMANTGCNVSSAPAVSGKHGTMIDMCCESSNAKVYKNVLCKLIEQELPNLDYVILYMSEENTRKLQSQEEFVKLLGIIKNSRKVGMKSMAVKRCNDKKSMLDDVRGAYLLKNDIYKDGNTKFIQVQALKYEEFEFSGLELKLKQSWFSFNLTALNANKMFFYVSQKCAKTVDNIPMTQEELQVFIKQIEDSLAVLHGSGYIHGDIKPKNIMGCGDANVPYKLIDWGRLKKVDAFDPSYGYGGSTQTGSPLGFYLLQRRYRNPLALQTTLTYLDMNAYKELQAYEAFSKDYWPRIKEDFKSLVESFKDRDDKALFDAHKYSLDTFNLGLSVLLLVLKNGLNLDNNRSYIDGKVLYKVPKNVASRNTNSNAKRKNGPV
jgi:serine/threonine protein kinase